MAPGRRFKAQRPVLRLWQLVSVIGLLGLFMIYRMRAPDAVDEPKYLYWGSKVDCPGKICAICAGLGHQESSLRCALEEAMVLNRTFVLPSKICIVGMHNGRLLAADPAAESNWDSGGCSIKSLYDLDMISKTVRVITDDSEEWLSAVRRAGAAVVHIQGVSRQELSKSPMHNSGMILNRTANFLAWFVECKDRKNRSSVLLPYSFLPSMAARPLREAALKIQQRLGDYDAMHVRRGDVLKLRKDGSGELRTKFPHLDRDTQPEAILRRISGWVPQGRTLYIASNEKNRSHFDPLTSRYKVVTSSSFGDILQPVIRNNYQLFMVDRLVLSAARTVIQTFRENPGDLSLTDDEKKVKRWEKPVYSFD